MQKFLLISSLLFSSLLADNNLGQKITVTPAQETIGQTPLRTRINPNQQPVISQQNSQQTTRTQLYTRTSPSNIKRTFKKDHHRYDKRYSNFDYDRNSYYNDDGYYYGYYDNSGYFYNNIYFTYNNIYTYDDRCHRRGHFRQGYHHRRYYRYHHRNDWNRVHCYRKPNVVVRGHYYDRSYYPRTRYYNEPYRSNYNDSNCNTSQYNHYRRPARMSVTRINGRTHEQNNNYNNSQSYANHSNSRMNNSSRNYSHNNSHRSTMQRRSTTRMSTSRNSTGRHMGMSR